MRKRTAAIEPSRGFPPVVGPRPRVLVLGSLPGRASIEAGQYYAQPWNAFWPIMGAICDAGPELRYAERLTALRRAGIALWDVLGAAERPGSLDARIVAATQEINDIAALVARQPTLGAIFFNGQKAADVFRRHIEPGLPRAITLVSLPSTSPAYASMRRDDKLAIWREALLPFLTTR